MKLRGRIALVTLAVAVPAVVLTMVLGRAARERAAVDAAARFVLDRMAAGGRAACEADPARWGRRGRPPGRRRGSGRGPGVRVFAYDAAFRPASPAAPPLGPALEAPLAAGAEAALELRAGPRRPVRRVAVAMPWAEGPCAVVLVEQPAPPGADMPFWRAAAPPVLVALGVIAVVLLALGPTVARLRRLTAAVRRSAAAGYAAPTDLPRGGDEVGELAAAFSEAAAEVRSRWDELQARDEALTQFLGNTTHDVMIPLTVLQGHLAAIAREAEAGRPPARETVRGAVEEAQYVGSLLQNLRLAARFESGAPDVARHPVDLGALVERVAARHEALARQARVSLGHAVPEASLVVEGDETMLEQAVGNLVHNAVRYGRPGGHVAVVLAREGDAGFSLRVLDDGPGLTDEELDRLTERGFRGGAARTRAPAGLGVGLHITATVLDAHGFELAFLRPDGGGLEARITGGAPSLEKPPFRDTPPP